MNLYAQKTGKVGLESSKIVTVGQMTQIGEVIATSAHHFVCQRSVNALDRLKAGGGNSGRATVF